MAGPGRVCIFGVLCLLMFTRIYQVVCDNHLASLCAIDGFDYSNLTAVTWFLTLNQQFCLSVNKTQPLSQCTLDMAIGHSVGIPGPCQNSSICSLSEQGYLSLGTYREDPFGPFETTNNLEGFQAVFTNGSQYTTTSGTSCLLQTNIVFSCNAQAFWLTPDRPESKMKSMDPKFMSYSNETCQLNLIFDFAGACKRGLTVSKHGGLSVGTILVIIFFVSVILYCSLGAMINVARGRVGTDVIPHASFWTMLPVYISDGFQFVFCCGRMPITATYEQI